MTDAAHSTWHPAALPPATSCAAAASLLPARLLGDEALLLICP